MNIVLSYAIIYSYHMALFFIITGVLLGYTLSDNKDIKKYSRYKVSSLSKKLLIPYFIWSAIYFVLDNPSSLGGWENIYNSLICTITFRGIAPVWFLGALFWSEIVTLAFLVITKLKRKPFAIITAIVAILFIICTTYCCNVSDNKIVIIQFIEVFVFRGLACSFFVMLGYLISPFVLGNEDKRLDYIVMVISFMISVVLVLGFNQTGNLHTLSISSPCLYLVSSVSGSLFVLMLCKTMTEKLSLKIVARAGIDSMGIMCIHYLHFPFMVYATEICTYFNLNGFIAFLVSFLIVFSISFFATEIIKRFKIV